mmetsp:Transcript_105829/g.210336  ORF Transcript_105829/g.210336 Transcript_105829/m.210336 type:complete len:120 (-) Transcript_105829:50-409(-)
MAAARPARAGRVTRGCYMNCQGRLLDSNSVSKVTVAPDLLSGCRTGRWVVGSSLPAVKAEDWPPFDMPYSLNFLLLLLLLLLFLLLHLAPPIADLATFSAGNYMNTGSPRKDGMSVTRS